MDTDKEIKRICYALAVDDWSDYVEAKRQTEKAIGTHLSHRAFLLYLIRQQSRYLSTLFPE